MFVSLTFLFFFFFVFFLSFVGFFFLSIFPFFWFFFSFSFFFGSLRVFFSFILFVVVLRVLVFCSFYLGGETKFKYFFFVFLVFIFRMFFLLISCSPLVVMVSWDVLGISSYFLVLFYNNWDSNIGRINVALTNRLGDFFLFFLFSFFFCSSSVLFFSFFHLWWGFLFIYLVGFTKRAQFPFRRWLPKAIRAPTPVRALVHSRTLVTAGIVLMLNFCGVLFKSELSFFLSFFGLFTMFFSRLSAIIEQDIKKIVALSTLSQMGFACFVLGLCLNFFCVFHLLRHALFKSCLFIQVGFFLYSSFGTQDGRGLSFLHDISFFVQFQLLLTLFCLCGLLFTGGLVSKDFLLEFLFSLSFPLFFFFFFFFSVFFTFFYSFRLWSGLFFKGGFSIFYFLRRSLSFLVSFFLIFFSIFFIWFSGKNLFFLPFFFSYWGEFFFFCLFFFVFLSFLFSSFFFFFYFVEQFSCWLLC